jgi:hypothetical protein
VLSFLFAGKFAGGTTYLKDQLPLLRSQLETGRENDMCQCRRSRGSKERRRWFLYEGKFSNFLQFSEYFLLVI